MERRQYFDQLGRRVDLGLFPKRIISLVPSQTELLFDLGVGNRVVGVTKFCIHPSDGVKSKSKVGGTKNFNLEIINQLKPDLIIGNKEENDESRIKALAEKYPVWMSDITDWSSAMQMIRQVGEIVDQATKATALVAEIERRFENMRRFQNERTLYLIWKSPWMAAGKNTFINTLLSKIGLTNCTEQERYPELSSEQIEKLSPQLVLLSSEPYPFKEKHVLQLKEILPKANIQLVDGEMFSWYGCRLLKAVNYFPSIKASLD